MPGSNRRKRSFASRIRKFFGISRRKHVHHRSRTSSVTPSSRVSTPVSQRNSAEKARTLPVSRGSGRRHHHRRSQRHQRTGLGFMKSLLNRIRNYIRENRDFNKVISIVIRQLFAISSFLAAYIAVWFIYQLAVIVTGSFFDIHSVLFYYEVMFPIPNTSPLWTDLNIIAITSSGPLISLLAGLILFYIVWHRKVTNPYLYQFLIWMMLISAAHFFGAFAAGAITWQGFGYVIAWMFMPFAVRLLVSILFLAVLAYLGWISTSLHLELATHKPVKEDKPYFILGRVVFPWLIASAILLLIKIPDAQPQHENIWDYDMFILGSITFAILPALFNRKAVSKDALRWPKRRRLHRIITSGAILAALIIILAYRLGLSHGIYVYLKIALDLSVYK